MLKERSIPLRAWTEKENDSQRGAGGEEGSRWEVSSALVSYFKKIAKAQQKC